MAGSRNSKSVVCKICNATISRSGDLPRHMKTHSENKDELTFHCPWQGCRYQSLQKSNVQTHIRTHTGVKDKKCPDCSFTTRDPGSLTRHRKRKHEYIPKRIGNRRKREGSSNGSDEDGTTNNNSPVTGEGPSREPSSGKAPSARPSRLDITTSPYARWQQPNPNWPQEALSQPSASSSSQPPDTDYSPPPSSTYTLQPARNWSAESNTPYSRRQPTPPWNASVPESERNQPVWPRDSLLLPEMRGAVPEPPWARQSPRRRSPSMLLPDPNNIDPTLDEDEDEDSSWRSPEDWSRNPDPNWERRRGSGSVRSPILPDPNQDEMDADWRRPSPFLPEGEISLYDNGHHHRPSSQRWSPSRRREDRPRSPATLGANTSNAVLDPALRPPSPIPPRIQTARALQRQATEKSTWDPALRPPSPIPPKTQSTRLPAQYRDIEVEQAQEQERRRRARENEEANYQSIVHPEPIPPRRRYLDEYSPNTSDPGPQPIPPRTRLPRRFYDNDNDSMLPMSAHPSNSQSQPQTRFIHHSTEERRYDPNFAGTPIPPRSQTIKLAGDEEVPYNGHHRPGFNEDEREDSPMTSADEDEEAEQMRRNAEKLSRQREMTLLATASRGRSKSFVASPQDARPQVNLNGQVASGSAQAPMGSLIRKWSGPNH